MYMYFISSAKPELNLTEKYNYLDLISTWKNLDKFTYVQYMICLNYDCNQESSLNTECIL